MYFPENLEELERVKKECMQLVNKRAVLSGAAAVVPLPGVDISADKGVMCVVIVSESSSKGYIIETSVYDETTNSYTCSTENGISFVVTINNDGTATISSPETQEALES